MSDLGDAVRPHLPRALAGDVEALGELWVQLRPFVVQVVEAAFHRYRGTGSPADVDDSTAAVRDRLLFLRPPALTRWDGKRPIEPWLRTVATNCVHDYLRKTTRDSERLQAAATESNARSRTPDPAEASAADAHATAAELDAIIDTLPHPYPVILHGIASGLSHKDAAARAGRSAKNAQRAKRALKTALSRDRRNR